MSPGASFLKNGGGLCLQINLFQTLEAVAVITAFRLSQLHLGTFGYPESSLLELGLGQQIEVEFGSTSFLLPFCL